MTTEQQDLAWACLPKKARDKIRESFNYSPKPDESVDEWFVKGWKSALEHFFGHHNLTSDTEPEEMLMVERSKVQIQYAKIYDTLSHNPGHKGAMCALNVLDSLFGDKCLPDNPNTPNSGELKSQEADNKPRFKIGDKVIVIDNIRAIYPDPMTIKGVSLAEDGKCCYNVIEYGIKFHEDNLEPYTEPKPKFNLGDKVRFEYSKDSHSRVQEINDIRIVDGIFEYQIGSVWAKEPYIILYTEPKTKDNMKEKELNLCELLNLGDTIYNPTFGYGRVDLVNTNIKPYFCVSFEDSFVSLSFLSNGIESNSSSRPSIWPNEELYEKYPLDPYSAWMEWKEERKPKRWRAKQYQNYWYLSAFVIPEITSDDLLNGDDKLYECGNYFRTKIEAQQAAEVVRETLMKFHEQNQK